MKEHRRLRSLTVAAAALLAFAFSIPAQLQFAELGRRGLPPNHNDTTSLAYGDVDADGDLDIVVGSGEGGSGRWQNRLYLNDGNGNYIDASANLTLNFGVTMSIALGDVDGDGDLDIVAGDRRSTTFGGRKGQDRIFLNDGMGVFTDDTDARMPAADTDTQSVSLGDVDGDGDLDIVLGITRRYSIPRAPGQDRLYLNDGNGFFSDLTATHMPPANTRTMAGALGDVDGDGDLDIVFANNGQQNRLYLNDGSGVFSDASVAKMPVDSDTSFAVGLGDLDGDGDSDIVFGNAEFGQPDRIYLNDGTGEFHTTGELLPLSSSLTSAIALGDADGDGDLDLALASFGPIRQNRLYLNNGNGGFQDVTPSRLPEDKDNTRAVAFVDADGDSDLDLVFGNQPDRPAPNQDRLYINDGNARFVDASTTRMRDQWYVTNAVALGDVDDDGDLDIAFGNTGQNRLYLNRGDGTYTDSTLRMPADESTTNALAMGDVDGDGDLDMVMGNRGQNRLLLNNGAGTFTDATAQRLPSRHDSGETRAVALGDVDGDGDLDILCGNGPTHIFPGIPIFFPPGPNRLYINDGDGFFTDVTASRLPRDFDNTGSLALGDVDGDGDLDLALGNMNTPLIRLGQPNKLYVNDGTGTFTDETSSRMPSDIDYTAALALGDVDNDGDLDIVLGNQWLLPVQNRLYLNDGTGVFTDVTTTRMPAVYDITGAVALGDVDEDGDLDILFGNRSHLRTAQNRLYLNDGTGTFTDATTPRLPAQDNKTAALALGDIDRDGDLDAVVANGFIQEENQILLNLLRQFDAPHRLLTGRDYRLDAYARYGPPAASDIAVPFVSAGLASIPLHPLGTIGIDPLSMVALPPFLIPQPAGAASLVRPFPSLPSLVGASIHAQAVLMQDPFPARLTNVLSDTVIQ